MRISSQLVLSDYILGYASLEKVRDFIERVDWDDPEILEDERSLLLDIELRLTGLDEGLNDESDVRDFIVSLLPILYRESSAGETPIIASTANNIVTTSGDWANPWRPPADNSFKVAEEDVQVVAT